MGSHETERKTTGWAARDPSGILSPYTYSLRNTGPEDVFIKVICCGICHTDIHQAKNDLGKSNYPMVPGHEVVAGHATQTVNNTVPRRSGRTTMSTPMVIPLKVALPVPWSLIKNGMAPEQVAPLLCAGITVYSPLNHFGLTASGLRGGVLRLGGVGHMGVKIAKAMGHHVTVISSSDKKKVEALEHLGADEYLVSSDAEGMQKAAGSLNYIIDTVPVFHPLEPTFHC
ncbi:hypothetical protein V6N12_010939 [Hibiscus sabdariffa]|uniref:Cinnamyl alcohol dehydrogenase n=1 Tax=Hibiscus sabdariffa TaxID=183260 RepID=A0ABR2ELK3_9ROSI